MKYTNMSEPELLAAMGLDASKWAEAFCEMHPGADQDIVRGWFANAMMAMHDHILGGPTVLPDGSAFFLADVSVPPEKEGEE